LYVMRTMRWEMSETDRSQNPHYYSCDPYMIFDSLSRIRLSAEKMSGSGKYRAGVKALSPDIILRKRGALYSCNETVPSDKSFGCASQKKRGRKLSYP